MNKIAIEDLIGEVILIFCENLAELGCPRDAEPDIWYRNLSQSQIHDIGSKILEIAERNSKEN